MKCSFLDERNHESDGDSCAQSVVLLALQNIPNYQQATITLDLLCMLIKLKLGLSM